MSMNLTVSSVKLPEASNDDTAKKKDQQKVIKVRKVNLIGC